MRFLTVAAREFQVASRRPATHRIRWVTASCFFAALVWLLWVHGAFDNVSAAPRVYGDLAMGAFFYCLLISAGRSADCISEERREGTLGLLFLTDLRSSEIISGKLAANATASCYGLMAIIPLLALPMLMGGVTFDHFGRTTLALLNAMWIGTAIGFAVSVASVRQSVAVGAALAATLMASMGVAGLSQLFSELKYPQEFVWAIAMMSPFYALMTASDAGTSLLFGWSRYWTSLVFVHLMSWAILAWVSYELSRTWRELPMPFEAWRARWAAWRRGVSRSARLSAFRGRILDWHPYLWLAGRNRVSAPLFVIIAAAVVGLNVKFFTRILGGNMRAPTGIGELMGHAMSWFGVSVILHVVAAYHAAATASQRLAEDKQNGALELVLSTPLSEKSIGRGLWLAFARAMLAPALITALVHFFFVWHVATLFVVSQEIFARTFLHGSPGNLIWEALTLPISTQSNNSWGIFFAIRILTVSYLVLAVNWVAIGWVARWLGLRMKHAGFAPLASLALVLLPPWFAFGMFCFTLDKLGLFSSPEQQLIPVMMWVAVAFCMAHCLLVSFWARHHLGLHLRVLAVGRFDGEIKLRAWLPQWVWVKRAALGAICLLILAFLSMVVFTYRARMEMERARVRLEGPGSRAPLETFLRPFPSEASNFARSAVFLRALHRKDFPLLARVVPQNLINTLTQGATLTENWQKQLTADLDAKAVVLARAYTSAEGDARVPARRILEAMVSADPFLDETLAELKTRTNFLHLGHRQYTAVFQDEDSALSALMDVQFLLNARAAAKLVLNDPVPAAADLEGSLRMARLASLSPDRRSSSVAQAMLCLAIQPLFDGLATQQWSSPQLARFQEALAGFHLLALNVSAVRRVAHAHADLALGGDEGGVPGLRRTDTGVRAWLERVANPARFGRISSIYEAARSAVDKVDLEGEQLRHSEMWISLHNSGLESAAQFVLIQGFWYGQSASSVAFVQTSVNQAILACALERFRLQEGSYPAELKALTPRFLPRVPNDLGRGLPMFYRLLDSGNIELRGAGFDRAIDTAKPASDDWIWSYEPPPKPKPPAKKK